MTESNAVEAAVDPLLETYRALGGAERGEFPVECDPPNSGDLSRDVPVLAAQVAGRVKTLTDRCYLLGDAVCSIRDSLHRWVGLPAAVKEAEGDALGSAVRDAIEQVYALGFADGRRSAGGPEGEPAPPTPPAPMLRDAKLTDPALRFAFNLATPQ